MIHLFRLLSVMALGCALSSAAQAHADDGLTFTRATLLQSKMAEQPLLDLLGDVRGAVLLVDCQGTFGHDSIQAAIDAAEDGDVVVVLPRNAFGFDCEGDSYLENINFSGKAITVQSLIPADREYVEHTIIDGGGAPFDAREGSAVTFNQNENSDSLLDGLTLTGGKGYLNLDDCSLPVRDGGGIFVKASSPTIRNCIITGNVANGSGGGIQCIEGAAPTIVNCTISRNLEAALGGGISSKNSSPTMLECLILANSAIEGGGVWCYSGEPVLRKCTITDNTATGGGGMWSHASSPRLYNCTFSGNSASDGGAIFCYNGGSTTLRNSLITNNTASTSGGAIVLIAAAALITNCTIAGNSTAGSGGGLYVIVTGGTALRNTIFWNNTAAGDGPQLYLIAAFVSVAHSDIQGGLADVFGDPPEWLEGNIDLDPLFATTHTGGYRLPPDSPCGNAGDPEFAPEDGETDIDGDPRVAFEIVDMGADEYAGPADCNGNGVPDETDIAEGFSEDCDEDGIPDECAPDCDGNGVADACEIIGGSAQDCNDNGLPDDCEWVDCNANTLLDECDVNDGESDDCNVNLIPDECELGGGLDCNDNANPDLCDISGGSSDDVNNNAVPDECEPNRIIYVDVGNCPGPGAGTEMDPFCIIRSALESALSGDEIVLADGVYTGAGNKNLNPWGRVVTVRSANGPRECIIDCEGCGRAFFMHSGEPPDARVEGLTIVNGGGVGSGGAVYLVASSPTVTNCVIVNGEASYGGGISLIDSGSTIANCILAGNTATLKGGAVYASDGSPTLRNCTIVGNRAGYGGALHGLRLDSAIMKDCIAWDNRATDAGPQLSLTRAMLAVSYSDVEGGEVAVSFDGDSDLVWGSGNLDSDPVFAVPGAWQGDDHWMQGNYHLLVDSPCVDWGDPDYLSEPGEGDIDGDPRVVDGDADGHEIVDMGADELVPGALGIVSSDPPQGAIDARQPHWPDDVSLRQGWDSLDVTFWGGNVSGLTPDDFSVTQEGGAGVPPVIAEVVQTDPASVTLILSGPVNPGAWTAISHEGSGDTVRLGFLPGDVNNDATSSPVDILALVDCLNGVQECEEWQGDTDRSGEANPADILRLIDLLNGAGEFDVWSDATLP